MGFNSGTQASESGLYWDQVRALGDEVLKWPQVLKPFHKPMCLGMIGLIFCPIFTLAPSLRVWLLLCAVPGVHPPAPPPPASLCLILRPHLPCGLAAPSTAELSLRPVTPSVSTLIPSALPGSTVCDELAG